ncbi:MAG: carboxypeptidase regulatory-like domain-containing protein [Planctomycetota bacterium]
MGREPDAPPWQSKAQSTPENHDPLVDSEATGESTRVDPGLSIEGRVTWNDGSPAADAEVRVVPAPSQSTWNPHDSTASTDASGSFRLRGFRNQIPVALHVRAVEPGQPEPGEQSSLQARRWRREHTWVANPAAIRPGSDPVQICMNPDKGTVRGLVQDSTGKPLAHASVTLRIAMPKGSLPMDQEALKLRTKRDGRFEFERVGGGDWVLSVTADEHQDAAPIPVTGSSDALTITLIPYGKIGGQITQAGLPLAGALAMLHGPENGGTQNENRLEFGDSQGRFEFKDLLPGQYRLEISTRSTGILDRREFTLSPGEILTDLRIEL